MPSLLSHSFLNEVNSVSQKRKDALKEVYKEIFLRAKNQIKRSAEIGLHTTAYTIPPFVVGFPVYSQDKAASYISRQFKNMGFQTSVRENDVHVSWKSKK